MPRRPGRPAGHKLNGPEIYRLRWKVHGLSAAELGAKVRFSADAVWKAERSESVSDILASRLAKALGVAVEDLLADGPGNDAERKIPALDANAAPPRERRGQE